MASYAALLSLLHTLNNLKNHPRPPKSLDKQQFHSLTQNLTFFLDFLERYSGEEDDDLESRITAAAYAAEDIIESHIVDQIHGKNISLVELHQGVERVIVDMDLIKIEVMEIMTKEKMNLKGSQHCHVPTALVGPVSAGQSSATVGFEDVLINKVLDKLTGQQCSLQIIPIVGMGGIGILKPNDDKSLEEVAKVYLKELIDRNLILVANLSWTGEANICKIHDLLRDVCLREAQNQKFLCLVRQQNHHNIAQRRICIDHGNAKKGEYSHEFLQHVVESTSLTRSLLYCMPADWDGDTPSTLHFGLLRVYSSPYEFHRFAVNSDDAIFEHANLRYLYVNLDIDAVLSRFCSLFSLLWNVETLMVGGSFSLKPMIAFKIWEMPLLRHVMFSGVVLPDPPVGDHNFVLENLQTLSGIINFKFSEEVVKRVPNIKKLKLNYRSPEIFGEEEILPDLCLNNLGRLQKLEYLSLDAAFLHIGDKKIMRRNLVSFPHSLKKLTLCGTILKWEDLTIRIGSLPFLQVLILNSNACIGPKWETVEGKFINLRVLGILYCYNLKYWDTDSAHFPRLEHLHLHSLVFLEEIPSNIGDIPMLKSIRVEYCSKSAEDSAESIKEEQEENGNEDLQVMICKS